LLDRFVKNAGADVRFVFVAVLVLGWTSGGGALGEVAEIDVVFGLHVGRVAQFEQIIFHEF